MVPRELVRPLDKPTCPARSYQSTLHETRLSHVSRRFSEPFCRAARDDSVTHCLTCRSCFDLDSLLLSGLLLGVIWRNAVLGHAEQLICAGGRGLVSPDDPGPDSFYGLRRHYTHFANQWRARHTAATLVVSLGLLSSHLRIENGSVVSLFSVVPVDPDGFEMIRSTILGRLRTPLS